MTVAVMNEARKRKIGLYSFIPMLAFLAALGYHLFAFKDEVTNRDVDNHIALATETYRHFTPLFVLYGVAACISLAVLLYFVVFLMRLKTMPVGNKLFWAFFLAVFEPISFPVFWYAFIRQSPHRLEIHPEI